MKNVHGWTPTKRIASNNTRATINCTQRMHGPHTLLFDVNRFSFIGPVEFLIGCACAPLALTSLLCLGHILEFVCFCINWNILEKINTPRSTDWEKDEERQVKPRRQQKQGERTRRGTRVEMSKVKLENEYESNERQEQNENKKKWERERDWGEKPGTYNEWKFNVWCLLLSPCWHIKRPNCYENYKI